MIFVKPSSSILLALASATYNAVAVAATGCVLGWTCYPTSIPPTLDADLRDWHSVQGLTTLLFSITGQEYVGGEATFKCLYDSTHIYLALEIMGDYRFNATDDHQCAAIATMMKIGRNATFVNMGGCPDALGGGECTEAVLDACDSHRVDIGAHWELKTTEMGVEYPIGGGGADGEAPGNDLVANKDDEYAVSPYCRLDDDGEDGGNEWAGAWSHSDPTAGAAGTYTFELSRLLQTNSTQSDAQLGAGAIIEFGIAFWDPYQLEDAGWTEAGHYLTGCGTQWIHLELATQSIVKGPNGSA